MFTKKYQHFTHGVFDFATTFLRKLIFSVFLLIFFKNLTISGIFMGPLMEQKKIGFEQNLHGGTKLGSGN